MRALRQQQDLHAKARDRWAWLWLKTHLAGHLVRQMSLQVAVGVGPVEAENERAAALRSSGRAPSRPARGARSDRRAERAPLAPVRATGLRSKGRIFVRLMHTTKEWGARSWCCFPSCETLYNGRVGLFVIVPLQWCANRIYALCCNSSTSCACNQRHWPGGRSVGKSSAPMRLRCRLSTRLPAAASMRLTW